MKLETERLILRDFVEEDWSRIQEYQNDPLYLRYYQWMERTPEAVQKFIGRMLEFQKQELRIKYQLAVVLRSTAQLIGNCGVRMDKADAPEADMGYELDPKHWNHGYATEAAHAMLDFGFHHFGVHRIWAGCIVENTSSAHVLEKLGMKLEGRFREHRYFKGRWWDSFIYAILEDEWQIHKQMHPVEWKLIEA
jgi:[ribosomal protein S5]-alanine N-acetyltransferase